MRNKIVALSLFALLLTAAAFGSWSHKLAVEVPFDFYVGNQAMPAGTYVIDSGSDANGGVLTLANQARGEKVVVATTPAKQSSTGKSELVFHRYGDTFFLSKIWNASSDTGRMVPPSEKQRELAENNGAELRQFALVFDTRR